MYPEDQFAIRMIKAGARGYLHKDSAPQVLKDAMRTIVEGKQYISAELTRLMIEEMAKDDNELPHKSLSDREYEVLLYIGEGKTMTEIANQLSLSIKTVSTYRSRILEKMRLKSNSDLVKYILLHDLAPGAACTPVLTPQDGLTFATDTQGLRTNPTAHRVHPFGPDRPNRMIVQIHNMAAPRPLSLVTAPVMDAPNAHASCASAWSTANLGRTGC